MGKVHSKIIKQVGVLGLIAIKNNINQAGGTNFYKQIKKDSMGFTAQNLIFHNLVMLKEFAQYN
jgi:hypothetical protein